MKQITDYRVVSPLVFSHIKKGVITNNFLCADDYKAEISEGNLFCIEREDFLGIYVKRGDFYRLYFNAYSEDAVFPDVDERCVCEITRVPEALLTQNGYTKLTERLQLSFEGDANPRQNSEKCRTGDETEIFSLITESFGKYTGYLPCFSQVRAECEKGQYYVKRINGKIVGALRYSKKGAVATINHLCTDKAYREKGLGKELCLDFLSEKNRALVWTEKENLAAINLYRSCGFAPSGAESAVYMKG